MANNNQIQVEPNSALPVISTVVQRVLIMVLSYFGLTMTDSDIAKTASLVASLILVLWGAYQSYRSNEAKKTMERHVSNDVATLKS